MWGLSKKKKDPEQDNNKRDELARKIANIVIRCRERTVRFLEKLDNAMTQTQRKIVFYAFILIWGGSMLYILGNAVRKEHGPFVLPMYDPATLQERLRIDSIVNPANHKINDQYKKTDNGKKGKNGTI